MAKKNLTLEIQGNYKPDDVMDQYNWIKRELTEGRYVVMAVENNVGEDVSMEVHRIFFKNARLCLQGKLVKL